MGRTGKYHPYALAHITTISLTLYTQYLLSSLPKAVRHGCGQRMRKLWRDSLLQVPKDPEVCCTVRVFSFMALPTSSGYDC